MIESHKIETGPVGRLRSFGQGQPVDEHIVNRGADGELVDAE